MKNYKNTVEYITQKTIALIKKDKMFKIFQEKHASKINYQHKQNNILFSIEYQSYKQYTNTYLIENNIEDRNKKLYDLIEKNLPNTKNKIQEFTYQIFKELYKKEKSIFICVIFSLYQPNQILNPDVLYKYLSNKSKYAKALIEKYILASIHINDQIVESIKYIDSKPTYDTVVMKFHTLLKNEIQFKYNKLNQKIIIKAKSAKHQTYKHKNIEFMDIESTKISKKNLFLLRTDKEKYIDREFEIFLLHINAKSYYLPDFNNPILQIYINKLFNSKAILNTKIKPIKIDNLYQYKDSVQALFIHQINFDTVYKIENYQLIGKNINYELLYYLFKDMYQKDQPDDILNQMNHNLYLTKIPDIILNIRNATSKLKNNYPNFIYKIIKNAYESTIKNTYKSSAMNMIEDCNILKELIFIISILSKTNKSILDIYHMEQDALTPAQTWKNTSDTLEYFKENENTILCNYNNLLCNELDSLPLEY